MSGLIPQHFIDELLRQTDIVELIDSYTPLKKAGNSFTACCPFHKEKSPSFNVIPRKQFYYCFGCSASGNAISFLMNYLNYTFIQAIELLASRCGVMVPRETKSSPETKQYSLFEVLDKVNLFYQKHLRLNQEAIQYLRTRGVNGTIAKYFELGFAPAEWHLLEKQFKNYKKELISSGMLIQNEQNKVYDRYRQRIMFPIHNRQGRIIGFGGRSIQAEEKPKYLNSPETVLFHKNKELYGLYQILQHKIPSQTIIIVEGYLDVIALAQYDIKNVVATLGTAISGLQIQVLHKYAQSLIFCFDGDEAGRKAAWRALENALPNLNTGINIHFIFLPEGDDPDSLVRREGREAFLQYCQKSRPFNQFLLEHLQEGLDLSSFAGKNQFLHLILPYISKIPSGPYQELLLNETARLTHLEEHRILQLIKQQKLVLPSPREKLPRSPLRLAIALVLQNPELVTSMQFNVQLLEPRQHFILIQLIQKIQDRPGINTAILLEYWRDQPYFEKLLQLASWDHQIPQKALHKEFLDIIHFLQKKNLEKKIQFLLEKSRNEGLTEAERLTLQEMLKFKVTIIKQKV